MVFRKNGKTNRDSDQSKAVAKRPIGVVVLFDELGGQHFRSRVPLPVVGFQADRPGGQRPFLQKFLTLVVLLLLLFRLLFHRRPVLVNGTRLPAGTSSASRETERRFAAGARAFRQTWSWTRLLFLVVAQIRHVERQMICCWLFVARICQQTRIKALNNVHTRPGTRGRRL